MDLVRKKVQDFFKNYKSQSYKKGEILIRADENPNGIFYLTDGMVKEYAISKKGEEIIVNIFKPQSFFPMSWAINESTNVYYYEALSTVQIQKAPKEKVLDFLKLNPDVVFDLLRRVYQGVDGLMSRMVYLMSETAYDRLIIELIIHAKRFGTKVGDKITVETSERDLAARSGMTRETISREMKKLKNKKLVELERNSLTIRDLKALEKELSDN